MADVIVLAEHEDGAVSPMTAELLTVAATLGEPVAVLLGAPATALPDAARKLGRWGASAVHAAGAPDARPDVDPGRAAALLADVVRHTDAAGVLLPATPVGNDVAALLALALDSGVITGATEVGPGFVVTKQALGGTYRTQAVVTRGVPVVTVRPGGVEPVRRERSPRVVVSHTEPGTAPTRVRVVGREPRTQVGVDIAAASVVVAGGRGTGGDLGPVHDLADALGGAVGGSRAAVDEGWLPYAAQVGQTGRTIAPDLYVAAGISGALAHIAGVRSAGTIVAVNSDPTAPVFQVADLGIVGDLFAVLPQAARAARARASRPEPD